MAFNQTEKQEKEYLKQIISFLKKVIGNTDASVKDHVDTLAEYKDYIWSNKDIDPHEIRSMRESILNHFALGESVINKHKRLTKILAIPYFGRIDFLEKKENSKVMPIYIGIHTFYDPESRATLIHDWRAPVSSMFYDHELGEAGYRSPSGEIKGVISLKRQYRIRGGKMEFMIESALTVHDDILQKELSSNADDKMKNIVATIQREQNRIIRNEDIRTLIIQGVAGSGKTSIALHRIAYLLYTFRDSISSKDILIISPNKVFSDYISNVLPELGEETVLETSMEQILSGVLEHKYKYQTYFGLVNELLEKPSSSLINRIAYKASFGFISELDKFILHIENTYFKAADVKLTKYITIPAPFIEEQYLRFNRYPIRRRFDAMADYMLDMLKIQYAFTVTTAGRNLLKKEIRLMFAGNNDIQVYKDFFKWTNNPGMFKMRKGHTLEYSDLAPLAYLHLALEGNGNQPFRVKHLLIDEMQDYSPIQYKVIQKLFPCRKTVLGDAGQSVNPYGSSTAETIQKSLTASEIMKLCKSYRSTFEITDFAQKIHPNAELEPVARHGEKPQILQFGSAVEELSGIMGLISTYRKSGYKSLGIICKTEQQARKMADMLKSYANDISFLSSQSSAFVQGIVTFFSYGGTALLLQLGEMGILLKSLFHRRMREITVRRLTRVCFM